MKRLFAFGLGYSAMAFALRQMDEGWAVAGTCRGQDKAEALSSQGIDAHRFDPSAGMVPLPSVLDGATHILSSIAPGADGDPVHAHFSDAIARTSSIEWIGYLSTTGVYGDSGGEWVDETSPTAPSLERAKRRVAAEQAWLALNADHGAPVHVFRLAGIYGPGRSVLDTIRSGKARRIDRPGHLFGRIHVDDIAATLRASVARPNPGAIYNVCDDEPAAPADVTTYGCSLLGVEPPPVVSFEDAAKEMSPMGRTFWEDSRKVSNRRLHEELGVDLSYPDFRSGLDAVLKAGG